MEEDQFNKYLGDIYSHGGVMFSIGLGHELGIVKFLCDAEEPVSVEDVSTKLNLKERYKFNTRSFVPVIHLLYCESHIAVCIHCIARAI